MVFPHPVADLCCGSFELDMTLLKRHLNPVKSKPDRSYEEASTSATFFARNHPADEATHFHQLSVHIIA